MSNFDPAIHHMRFIRLKGYDYSQPGFYFLTFCVQNKTCLFGYITHGTMFLNGAGKMVEKWYWKLESKFPGVKCHQMVVMPNHFHCIIQKCPVHRIIQKCPVHGIIQKDPVGADPCVCPEMLNNGLSNGLGESLSVDLSNGSGNGSGDGSGNGSDNGSDNGLGNGLHTGEGEHMGSPLRVNVQWFKTMTTNEYIRGVKNDQWPRFNGKLWQRNYYEHIIRTERSCQYISDYIINNPLKWKEDKFNV